MLACVPAASSTVEDALGRDVVMANVQLFRLAISVTVPDVSDGGRFNQSTLGLNPNISSAGIAITVQPQSAVTPELRPQSILRPVILVIDVLVSILRPVRNYGNTVADSNVTVAQGLYCT